jgi:hypothetical protein
MGVVIGKLQTWRVGSLASWMVTIGDDCIEMVEMGRGRRASRRWTERRLRGWNEEGMVSLYKYPLDLKSCT